tara:strand:+ start:1440 stop:1751 length:312 start_codon:yes stop_codon:yes gene_type:complete
MEDIKIIITPDGIQEVDLTSEEKTEINSNQTAWENGAFDRAILKLREDRNKLLADSDWEVTMAKEKGTTLSASFKNWRQALRDITNDLTTVEEVEAVEFPEKP